MSSQIVMTGEVSCEEWTPNPFKKEKCRECGACFTQHKAEAVTDDMIRDYIGAVAAKEPANVIVEASGSVGALYLGGAMGIGKGENLRSRDIGAVVQTAQGMETFFPIVGRALKEAEEAGTVAVLRMEWDDSPGQQLDGLEKAVSFVHEQRMKGRNVLVNCAQGKSRSSSCVVAYLLAIRHEGMAGVDEALRYTQARRAIAEPNVGFMRQLGALEKEGAFAEMHAKLVG